MNDTQTKTQNRTKTKMMIDTAIFIAFLIAMDPRSSGIAIHEWLATSAFATIVVHLLLSWDWIAQTTRRIISTASAQTRINYILNWTLFLDLTFVMLSGFMISQQVVPALGINLTPNFTWRSLHEISTNLFLVILGLHTALHWNWIVDTFKRYLLQPFGRIFSINKEKDITL